MSCLHDHWTDVFQSTYLVAISCFPQKVGDHHNICESGDILLSLVFQLIGIYDAHTPINQYNFIQGFLMIQIIGIQDVNNLLKLCFTVSVKIYLSCVIQTAHLRSVAFLSHLVEALLSLFLAQTIKELNARLPQKLIHACLGSSTWHLDLQQISNKQSLTKQMHVAIIIQFTRHSPLEFFCMAFKD